MQLKYSHEDDVIERDVSRPLTNYSAPSPSKHSTVKMITQLVPALLESV